MAGVGGSLSRCGAGRINLCISVAHRVEEGQQLQHGAVLGIGLLLLCRRLGLLLPPALTPSGRLSPSLMLLEGPRVIQHLQARDEAGSRTSWSSQEAEEEEGGEGEAIMKALRLPATYLKDVG